MGIRTFAHTTTITMDAPDLGKTSRHGQHIREKKGFAMCRFQANVAKCKTGRYIINIHYVYDYIYIYI